MASAVFYSSEIDKAPVRLQPLGQYVEHRQDVTRHLMPPSYATRNKADGMKHLDSLSSRTFPDQEADLNIAKQVASALVVDFAHYRSHHKVIARIAGASPKSAENWLAGDHPPSLVYFLRLLPHSPSLRKLVAMEADLSPDFQRELSALIQRHIR
jgi:hypothetical protein